MKIFMALAAASTAALLGTGLMAQDNSIQKLTAVLDGANEVPAVDGGSGFTDIRINERKGTICYTTVVSLAAPDDEIVFSHIHRGTAGMNGGVEVTLIPGSQPNRRAGCVDASPSLIQDILANPENFYVNVHSTTFRGGAVRGQLQR